MYNTHRPTPPDPVEEDAFCAKMRLIGAEFWETPADLDDPECFPLERCAEPKIRGQLGIT